HQLQELEPDDLVDQRRTAAADEQHEQHGQKPARRCRAVRWGQVVCGHRAPLSPGKRGTLLKKRGRSQNPRVSTRLSPTSRWQFFSLSHPVSMSNSRQQTYDIYFIIYPIIVLPIESAEVVLVTRHAGCNSCFSSLLSIEG